jgi:UDP-N-acetylmuramate dehydrogenase
MVNAPMTNPRSMPAGFERDVPLGQFTTIGIGGPARFFFRAGSVDALRESLEWAAAGGIELFILGGGSNLLIADEGFDGLVIQIALDGVIVQSEDRYVMVKAAAGEPWDPFVARAVRNRWAGIESLSGIPGSVGATPIQNVGAYGQDVSETIVRVEALDRHFGTVRWFTNAECHFGYRRSLFKNETPNRYIILSVVFRLEVGGDAVVRYPELQRYLDDQGVVAGDLASVREAVLAIRRLKGMVLDAADPDTRSDGSFFMNPILQADAFIEFRRGAQSLVGSDARIPAFPAGDGSVKLSAAWLIEHAGFQKGFVHGNAGLSSKHTLAVINRGGATAREVLSLVRMIQRAVHQRFGIEIQPEPNFIGIST